MGELSRIKEILFPPVTAEWVDLFITGRAEMADRIESEKGLKAADRYRAKTGELVSRMLRRGVVPSE